MNLKKKLFAAVALFGILGTTVPILNTNNTVQAAKVPKKYRHLRSGHYVDMYGDFYVKLTKPIKIYKIHWRSPMALSTLSKYKMLKKGRKVHIFQPEVNYSWYIWGKGLPGASNGHWKYALTKKQTDYSWFKVISVKK